MTPDANDTGARVGAYVAGPPDGPRQVVRWDDQLRHHELAAPVDPDREAYLSLYHYPLGEYGRHFVRAGDLAAALADARAVVRFVLGRYGPKVDGGVAAYFSGSKGFHVLLDLLPGWTPTVGVPAACKRLALAVAARAGVRVDPGCYDHQRLVRLPNSRHPATGLYKRFLTPDELFALDVPAILELARYPAGTRSRPAGRSCRNWTTTGRWRPGSATT